MLRHLIAFWQVGIEIVFAGKIIVLLYFAVARQTHANGVFHRFFVGSWQCAGVAAMGGEAG